MPGVLDKSEQHLDERVLTGQPRAPPLHVFELVGSRAHVLSSSEPGGLETAWSVLDTLGRGGDMRSLFVMDPLERIVVAGDSTYVTMRECTDRGFDVFMCTPDALFSRDGMAYARALPVATRAAAPFFETGDEVTISLDDVDVVWMRKDPPFDMTYIFTTYLLDMAPPSTLVVNGPRRPQADSTRRCGCSSGGHEFQPDTLITNRRGAHLKAYVQERGSERLSFLKPWDGNGGRGVLVTRSVGTRTSARWRKLLTQEGHALRDRAGIHARMSTRGDKRILLIEGEPVGAINRESRSPQTIAPTCTRVAGVEPTELNDSRP